MKTATMTWLHNGNYGTVLQAWALQKTIERLGHENIIIDYRPSVFIKTLNLFTSGNNLNLFLKKLYGARIKHAESKAFSKIKGNLDTSSFETKDDALEKFVSDELKTSTPFITPWSLRKLRGSYDTYICGSDQIWNPDYLNPPYFFNYLSDNDKKIAYGPSFGVKKILNKRKEKYIKRLLSKFSHLSLRETLGLPILENMGFNMVNIPAVLDPTLLCLKDDWDAFANIGRKIEENYILCYFLHSNSNYWKSIEIIRKVLGLKVYAIPASVDVYNQNDIKILKNVGPKEWVSLIKDAELVLTDSFHSAIFSIIFHTNFYIWKRFADDDPESQNSRVESLMEKFNIIDRLVSKSDLITKIDNCTINFELTDKRIEKDRIFSLDYLKHSIED